MNSWSFDDNNSRNKNLWSTLTLEIEELARLFSFPCYQVNKIALIIRIS